ncbi:hypothetical protein M8C21_027675 [Ambrosia artemisiifolia]|uniref:Thioredoxin domain-containing protein n=1 Tax=Ambrosia artemisiifolia TaxID=4212 RepID=A0AAD5DIJ2_AMBAR|nr:hypothetical protein M8C21_027675 [Ambrosia artemisiifolia]
MCDPRMPKSLDYAFETKQKLANNFDEIVLDESKDVLLEIYAPWCGHWQALEPTYNKLLSIYMDGSTNEHPRAKANGYPTILFYPAGNKSSDLKAEIKLFFVVLLIVKDLKGRQKLLSHLGLLLAWHALTWIHQRHYQSN